MNLEIQAPISPVQLIMFPHPGWQWSTSSDNSTNFVIKFEIGKDFVKSSISELDQLTCMLISWNFMWPVEMLKFGRYWSSLENSIPMVIQWTKCRLGGYVGQGNPQALFRTELALSGWDTASGTLFNMLPMLASDVNYSSHQGKNLRKLSSKYFR